MWSCGSKVQAKLVEKTGERSWIVSLSGKLMGVQNQSGISLRVGQWVELEVVEENPLKFQVIGKGQRKNQKIQIRV